MDNQRQLYKAFNNILIAIVFVLLVAIVALVWVNQSAPPSPQAGIEVVKNARITVPSVIKEGETFSYRSTGEKLVASTADVRVQMVCQIDGTESISTIATFVSNRSVGDYDDRRTTAISPSSKLVSSDDCVLQFANQYTIYQENRSGDLQPIIINDLITTNKFRFETATTSRLSN